MKKIFALLFFTFCLLSHSCSSGDDNTPITSIDNSALIKKVSIERDDENLVYIFTYDSKDRLVGIDRESSDPTDEYYDATAIISYYADQVVVSTDEDFYGTSTTTYEMNPSTYYAISSDYNGGSTYTYTSDGYLDLYKEYGDKDRQFFYDLNNNCININCTQYFFTEEFTYYSSYLNNANLDINSIVGNGDSHFTIYGYDTILNILGKKSYNLVKSWSDGSGCSAEFSYEFNNIGLPCKVYARFDWDSEGTDDFVYTIEYQ